MIEKLWKLTEFILKSKILFSVLGKVETESRK